MSVVASWSVGIHGSGCCLLLLLCPVVDPCLDVPRRTGQERGPLPCVLGEVEDSDEEQLEGEQVMVSTERSLRIESPFAADSAAGLHLEALPLVVTDALAQRIVTLVTTRFFTGPGTDVVSHRTILPR